MMCQCRLSRNTTNHRLVYGNLRTEPIRIYYEADITKRFKSSNKAIMMLLKPMNNHERCLNESLDLLRLIQRSLTNIVLVVAIFLFTETRVSAGVEIGDTPKLDFVASNGQRINSETLRGKIVLVEFWAAWCGPCVYMLPHTVQLHHQYGQKGVQVIGVNLDRKREVFEEMVESKGLDWPHYFDGRWWRNRIAKQWGVNAIPRTFLLSPDGVVLWQGHSISVDEPLHQALKKYPPRLLNPTVNPNLVKNWIESLEAAQKANDKEQFLDMLTHAAEVPLDGLTDQRVMGQVRLLASKLRIQKTTKTNSAPDKSTALLQQVKEDNPSLAMHLTNLLQASKTQVDQKKSITPRDDGPPANLVEATLARAELSKQENLHLNAYKLYRWLLEQAGDTDAGLVAADRIAIYEADTNLMFQIRSKLSEEQAQFLLNLARQYLTAGKTDLARKCYDKIITDHPQTSTREEASRALQTIEQK